MSPLVIAAILSTAAPAEMSTTGSEPGISTQIIEPKTVYTVNVSPSVAVHLHFPFACYEALAPKELMAAKPIENYPNDVLFVTLPTTTVGEIIKGNVICDQGVRLSFRFVVSPVEEVSPRVEFQWAAGELTAINSAVQAALADKAGECDRKLKIAQMSKERSDLETTLSRVKKAFVQRYDRETARKGSVIVYVDSEKRLGDVGVIEFRVQNREAGSIYVDQVEVANVGSSMPPHVVLISDNPLLENPTTDGDLQLADLSEITAAALIPNPLLQAGTTIEGAVAFAWPADTTRFELTVRVRAPEPRAIVVKDIDF